MRDPTVTRPQRIEAIGLAATMIAAAIAGLLALIR